MTKKNDIDTLITLSDIVRQGTIEEIENSRNISDFRELQEIENIAFCQALEIWAIDEPEYY